MVFSLIIFGHFNDNLLPNVCGWFNNTNDVIHSKVSYKAYAADGNLTGMVHGFANPKNAALAALGNLFTKYPPERTKCLGNQTETVL